MTQPQPADTAPLFDEQTFVSGDVQLHYVLQEAPTASDTLVVGFSAQHRASVTPRYSSIKVLRDAQWHRLFILDDHGPRAPYPRGCWYMGHRRSFTVAQAVVKLIDHVVLTRGFDRRRVITCGSSKGGWAAIYFAFAADLGHAIAGEPQSYMGLHLLGPERSDDLHAIGEYIAGGRERSDREFLDELLFDRMRSSPARPNLHVLAARAGPYLNMHIAPLVALAQELGVSLDLDYGEFAEHDDLATFFPPYLTAKISAVADGDSTVLTA